MIGRNTMSVYLLHGIIYKYISLGMNVLDYVDGRMDLLIYIILIIGLVYGLSVIPLNRYLNELYDLLQLEHVDYGNHVGWSAAQMFDRYWSSWIHFWHEEVNMEDGMECTIIHFTEPLAGFEDY